MEYSEKLFERKWTKIKENQEIEGMKEKKRKEKADSIFVSHSSSGNKSWVSLYNRMGWIGKKKGRGKVERIYLHSKLLCRSAKVCQTPNPYYLTHDSWLSLCRPNSRWQSPFQRARPHSALQLSLAAYPPWLTCFFRKKKKSGTN